MKKLVAIAAFVLLFSLPAHAQGKAGGAVGSSGSASPYSSGSGSSGGGGGFSGSQGGHLSSYPPAVLGTSAVSGGDPSFAPSTFLSFDQAVAEGKAINDESHKSLAQIAAENTTSTKAKAKFSFVQDAEGKVVRAAQQ